jgi:G3E family GTPase
VLGGALGAGKTTVVNAVLRQAAGRRVAVFVNDFGAIDIDADLIIGRTERTVSLENGCICCSLQGDLASAVLEMLETTNPPDALLIEASGVANPRAVARVLQRLAKHHLIRLDSVAVVADAERIMRPVNDDERRFTLDQLSGANLVVLSKRDLVDAMDYGEVKNLVTEVIPGARIVDAENGRLPIDLLLDAGLADELMGQPDGARDRTLDVDTWSFTSDRSFDSMRLKNAIWHLPRGIVRAKGIIGLDDDPPRTVVFQLVGRRATLTQLGANKMDATSRLVVIGVAGSVDPAALEELFMAALSKP